MDDLTKKFASYAEQIINEISDLYMILDRDFTIVGGSNAYFKATLVKRENVIGHNIFEIFPDNPDDMGADSTKTLRGSLQRVVQNKVTDTMAVQKYDVRRPGTGEFEERYWSPVNMPVFDTEGKVSYILHRAEDVTEFIRLKEKEAQQNKVTKNLQVDDNKLHTEVFQHAQEIQRMNEKLRNSESATAEINAKLEIEKKALEESNNKMALLTELIETMLSCNSIEEITKTISTFLSKILDFSKGMVYLTHNSRNFLEVQSVWGDFTAQDNTLLPDECWGLRRGYRHFVTAAQPGVPCNHIKNFDIEKAAYLCIPLSAQNEIYGLLYLELSSNTQVLTDENNMLISAVSESIALAIANVKLRELLRNQSIHDALTGLYNRRFLDEYLNKQLIQAKRQQVSLAVIMFDIDNFKKINDTYGHEAGDQILMRAGKAIQAMTRGDDVACRYGGEEFLIVLSHCTQQYAVDCAEKYRTKFLQIDDNTTLPAITLSLGVAVFPEDGGSAVELIEAADKALYHAKNTGKNKVVTFSQLRNAQNSEKGA